MPKLRPNPTNLEGHTELDARVSPSTGKELAQEIIDAVEWSQKFIKTTLADVLVVTQKQFVSLQDYTESMYHTEDRMFITPFNVMEVKIDRDVDIVQAVDDAMQEVEDAKAENPTDPPSET